MLKLLPVPPLPPPPPPPPPEDTITVTTSRDFRGTAQLGINAIEFAGFDFSRAVFDSTQFGSGLISDAVAITGDNFRNFIDVHLAGGETNFSAASWTFSNWFPFNPLQNDEITIFGSASSDTITGSIMSDGLIGGDGDDVLSGLDGRDILIGGNGVDTLIGGAGDDNYRLEDVHAVSDFPLVFDFDTVIEGADGGIDTVLVHQTAFWDQYALPENVENGFINAPGSFTLTGNDLANVLTGNDDANTLRGQTGADTLRGQGGNDTLVGGSGDDTMDGGAGIDTASYGNAKDAVSVNLATGQAQGTTSGNDTLFGIENLFGSVFGDTLRGDDFANLIEGAAGADILFGEAGRDQLFGGNGGDRIAGGLGNDTIAGGGGRDRLNGGGSSDVFIFEKGSNVDTIVDFTDGGGPQDDQILIAGYTDFSIGDIGKTRSGDDLILDLGFGSQIVIVDYLANHGLNAINDDILIGK